MEPTSEHYRTAIVALGHIAYNLPDKNPLQIKNIVSRKVSNWFVYLTVDLYQWAFSHIYSF